MEKEIIIAIDGFSSCGKSTLAKDLANKLGYIFIDSGAMYRGVALFAIENGIEQENEKIVESLSEIQLSFKLINNIPSLFLNGENVESEIRKPKIANHVSRIAKIKEVREKLVEQQRKMGESGGIVMDGRDIGTTVFPDAALKLFVTAEVPVRTKRRLEELTRKGIETNYAEVEQNLIERDEIDSNREISPLKIADNAIIIDNTELSPSEQLEVALSLVNETRETLTN